MKNHVEIGTRFGKWTTTGETRHIPNKKGIPYPFTPVKCECGTEKLANTYHLLSGRSTACGCHKKNNIKHGQARRGVEFSREYKCWRAMTRRCSDTKLAKYHRYGGRGIKVCQRWLDDFNNFESDMGKCPTGSSLHRINNDGDYEPANCKWANAFEQAQNTSKNRVFTVRGITNCLANLCRHFGADYNRTVMRLNKNKWTIDDALFMPDLLRMPIAKRKRLMAEATSRSKSGS